MSLWVLKMGLDGKVRRQMERLLTPRDHRASTGHRLLVDARRLWDGTRYWVARSLIAPDHDTEAVELACLAIQLPLKDPATTTVGKFGLLNLRDRADQAAEELVSELDDPANEDLLNRTSTLLRSLALRSPPDDATRLLADVVNLDDFGVVGIVAQAMQLASLGNGIDVLLESASKRDAYGYWEARLKDGFHFNPIRERARRRLEHARQFVLALRAEVEDEPR